MNSFEPPAKPGLQFRLKRTTPVTMKFFRVRFFRPRAAGREPTWTEWQPGALPRQRYEAMYDRLVSGGERFECEVLLAPAKAKPIVSEADEV